MTDRLTDMLAQQLDLQREVGVGDPRGGGAGNARRNEYISMMVLACTDELHEALRECGWKPWSSTNHVNVQEFRNELVDAFHFFLNLWMATMSDDASPETMADALYRGYLKKRAVNAKRQEAGYDG